MARLPPISAKDPGAGEGPCVFDSIVASRGACRAVHDVSHAPKFSERVAHLGAYVAL